MMAYQDHLYTGGTGLLETYYEDLKRKTLMGLAREDGLITTATEKVDGAFMQQLGFSDTTARLRDIVDWPPAQEDTGWKLATPEGERDGHQMLPVNTVVNCFFYHNMELLAEIAALLGRPADKDQFEMMASRVKHSINTKLFDPEKGIYTDGEGATHSSLHSNMMPLAFGLVPESHVESVVNFIKSRGMACSVYGAQYLLEGLFKAGEAQYGLDLMRATGDRSWWNMIRSGSTITMEAWDQKYKPNLDWNHAWGAVPANIIPRYLWGIRPASPGFASVVVQPRLADLQHSSITCPTIRGPVHCEFRAISDRLKEYTIELPANMVGDLVLEQGDDAADLEDAVITINGVTVNPGFGSIRLQPGMNTIRIQINSF